MLSKIGLIVLACIFAVAVSEGTNYPIQPITGSDTTPSTPANASSTSAPTESTTVNASTPLPTTSIPPTTPTPVPSSSTTSAPNGTVTTAAPTTLPPATVGKWRVKEADSNVTCLLVDMAIQVDVAMDINKTDHFVFDVPSSASANDSKCGNNSQSLVLSWVAEGNNSLTFQFDVNGTNFVLSHILLNITKNATVLIFHNDVQEFPTPLTKSYHCAKEQDINLKQDGNKTAVATLKVNSVQWEAFHKKADENFSAAEDCATSNSPDIVPIAVGCALVGLVAIVLIAYLVGRRRSQARGYLSM